MVTPPGRRRVAVRRSGVRERAGANARRKNETHFLFVRGFLPPIKPLTPTTPRPTAPLKSRTRSTTAWGKHARATPACEKVCACTRSN